jgi:hypothetical protein
MKGTNTRGNLATSASFDNAALTGIVRIQLADQEKPVTAALNGFANHFLGAAFAIHFRGIDQANPAIERGANRPGLAPGLIAMLTHTPGAETKSRHAVTRW